MISASKGAASLGDVDEFRLSRSRGGDLSRRSRHPAVETAVARFGDCPGAVEVAARARNFADDRFVKIKAHCFDIFVERFAGERGAPSLVQDAAAALRRGWAVADLADRFRRAAGRSLPASLGGRYCKCDPKGFRGWSIAVQSVADRRAHHARLRGGVDTRGAGWYRARGGPCAL